MPSPGADDCSDGTCIVTATMRQRVLGRDMVPSLSRVSSWSTSPRAGMTRGYGDGEGGSRQYLPARGDDAALALGE